MVCSLSACHENHFNPNANLSKGNFSSLAVDEFRMSSIRITENIGRLIVNDNDTMLPDYYTRSYYLSKGTLLWVNRKGVTNQADSLLEYLKRVDEIGFSPSRFYANEIESDLLKFKSLDFNVGDDINFLIARLDYNLTKAYLRYVIGQRYGFINPMKVFNKLDIDENDTTQQKFRQLYDIYTEHISKKKCAYLLSKIVADSVCYILKESESQNPMYKNLKSILPKVKRIDRMKVLVNMERSRWRHDSYPYEYDKYVMVNIPSYGLIAVDGDDRMSMKVVCGSDKTKTPLLYSSITRMDINPKWVVPISIVKNELSKHAGDKSYFERNNYLIVDRSTGKKVSPAYVTYDNLKSGGYSVIQTGGEGNSLGRIIFRFNNNFSIYLHDTSSRSTFDLVDRSASHGCIRVQKPYELAQFLLKGKDNELLDKIKYSMNIRTKNNDGIDKDVNNIYIDKSRIINSVNVKPQIPIFITYYTMCVLPDGNLENYSDVYGYDEVISKRIKDYIK